ncbi:MAG: hypothetical protein L5657_06705, partial [Calditerricola sp.]|nr:hypothetical protein [Calditerricola sp.]
MGKFLKALLLIALLLSTALWRYSYFVFLETGPEAINHYEEVKSYFLAFLLAHVLLLANGFFVTRRSALRYVIYAPYTAYFLYNQPAQPALKRLLPLSPLGKWGTLIAAAALAALDERLLRLSPLYALLYNSLFLILLVLMYIRPQLVYDSIISYFWSWELRFLGIDLLLVQVLVPFFRG